MHMLFMCDIFLIELRRHRSQHSSKQLASTQLNPKCTYMIDMNFLLAVRRSQQLQEITLEVVRETRDVLSGIFADEQHLPHVRLGLRVAFEAILVALRRRVSEIVPDCWVMQSLQFAFRRLGSTSAGVGGLWI